jgi:hypothetical protein
MAKAPIISKSIRPTEDELGDWRRDPGRASKDDQK